MDIEQIQTRLDALVKAMGEKGLRLSSASFQMDAYADGVNVVTKHAGPGEHWADSWIFHKGNTPADAFSIANAWCAGLPTPEERHRKEFLTLAGKAADYAAENLPGDEIASAVRASIVAGMQRLSENMLADQRGGA